MLLNNDLIALRDAGRCTFDEADIGGRKIVVVLPDGRRNVMPYRDSELRHGQRWTNFASDMDDLSARTSVDAMEIIRTLHARIDAAIPGVRLLMHHFHKGPDRPLRFRSVSGRLTVHGGVPMRMADVEAEADRIIAGHAAALKAVDAAVASWKATTIDACYVTMAAGMTGLDGFDFFHRITRDPDKVEGILPEDGPAVASVPSHEVSLPCGLVVRVVGRSVTATLRTSKYTLDAGRLIIKDSPQPPETVLSAVRGRPLDEFIRLPDFDGSELIIGKIAVKEAGKKLQMTVQFEPRPLRMDAARELYDRLRARAAA